MATISLRSKFRGCLLGALLGDCLGSPFEYIDEDPCAADLQRFFDKLSSRSKGSLYQYTDDTAMTICIAQSLLAQFCLDEKDLAKRFVEEYFEDKERAGEYGVHVRNVFLKLRDQNCSEPFKPASEQFNGSGSYGNGGAMRISPVALFYHRDFHEMYHAVEQATKITHTHKLGINGAILQCLAIQQALSLQPENDPLDVSNFVQKLILKMQSIEQSDIFGTSDSYLKQLDLANQLLVKEGGASRSVVQEALGNDISALFSVPTAIYAFLRAQTSIPEIQTENKFQRTIQYAIYLGGDTDTIASMAGAIAGAYFGEDEIDKSLRRDCENVDGILHLADQLYELIPHATGCSR